MTAEQDGWAQITLESGESGWVLQSLLHHGQRSEGAQTAKNESESSDPARAPRKPRHYAAMVAMSEDRSRTRKVARHSLSAQTATHKRHAQHQEPARDEDRSETRSVARHSKAHHKSERQVARLEHHSASPRRHHADESEVAVSSHKRHAKRAHSEESETKVARVHHRRHTGDEEQVAGSRSSRRHRNREETQVAKVTHHSRKHAAQSSERHLAREDYGSSRHHATGEADAPEASNDIVRTAYGYRGTPYVWGGERPGGFDCSGFTLHLYGKKGISLPHSARAQFGMGKHVEKNGMKPGDLVFFHTVTPGISHVGMYVGSGKFVHASSRRSGGVRVDNIESGYYSKAFRGARRMKGE